MNKRDDLGNRMKKYEYITRTHLVPRTPVIIRLDGKAFHSFTKGFNRPFDNIFVETMQDTMKYLCENIQGCVLGYTQSDEITLVLIDYKKLNSSSWFDYNIQKCCSIAASMATLAFNRCFEHNIYSYDCEWRCGLTPQDAGIQMEHENYMKTLRLAATKGALFDARIFNIPKEEVTNCILWRQEDATRNSIQMVGQANFSHKELQNKSCNTIQEMLFSQKGINWNDTPTHLKRGSCCIKVQYELNTKAAGTSIRNKWEIDTEIPIFKGEGRKYIDDLIFIGE